MTDKRVGDIDRELAAIETREATAALEQLLLGQAPGEMIDCQRVGVLVRLVAARAAVATD